MYRPAQHSQDSIYVPQLVFSKLTATGADDARFRVALYALAQVETDAASAAVALHISSARAQRALDYWEGAGLLEQIDTEPAVQPAFTAGPRRRLTTGEVAAVAEKNRSLAGIVGELQRIFGGVVSQADINIFVTLYETDKMPADLILLAAGHCVTAGKPSARYIEKLLLSWRREGIADAHAADQYLKLLAEREERENIVADLFGFPKGHFNVSERKKIASWHEDYSYGQKMLSAAMLAAGEKQNDIRYIDGILKQWHRKGYKTPQDLQMADGNRNLRVQAEQASIAPEKDILMNTDTYIPLKPRRGL